MKKSFVLACAAMLVASVATAAALSGAELEIVKLAEDCTEAGGGSPTCSASIDNTTAANLFDNVVGPKNTGRWISTKDAYQKSPFVYATYTFASPTVVDAYSVQILDASGYAPLGRGPKTMHFYGTNDSLDSETVNWTLLDVTAGGETAVWTEASQILYFRANPKGTAYTSYKWETTMPQDVNDGGDGINRGGQGYIQISELQFFSAFGDSDVEFYGVEIVESEGGTVTAAAWVVAGESIGIAAMPDTEHNYKFVNWVVTGGTVEDANAATTTFTPTEDGATIQAVFQKLFTEVDVVRNSDGSYTVTGGRNSGTGALYAGYECKGETATFLMEENAQLGVPYSYTFPSAGLPANATLRFFISADEVSNRILTGGETVYTGTPSIAVEQTGNNSWTVTLSRSATENVLCYPLTVYLATEGQDFYCPNGAIDSFVFGEGVSEIAFALHDYAGTAAESSFTIQYAPGNYTPDPENGSVRIAVTHPRNTIYVDGANGNDANTGDSKETAMKTIEAAVSAFGPVNGGTICLLPGEYQRKTGYNVSGITIANPIVLRADDSATADNPVVIIRNPNDQGWGSRNIFILKHKDAVIEGMTIRGGWTTDNGIGASSVRILPAGGTVRNCIFESANAKPNTGASGTIAMDSEFGVVSHCIFRNLTIDCSSGNTADYGAAGVYMTAGLLADSLFYGCKVVGTATKTQRMMGAVSARGTSKVVNCTMLDCYGRFAGGVYAEATAQVFNTVIVNCESNQGAGGAVIKDAWNGSASAFLGCATDEETPINEFCKTGTAASFFRTYAAPEVDGVATFDFAQSDLRPKCGSALYNGGVSVASDGTTPVPLSALDLRGKSRVQGSKIDIGAFEAPSGGFRILVQ